MVRTCSAISNYMIKGAFDQPKPSGLMLLINGPLRLMRYIGPFLYKKLLMVFDELMLLMGWPYEVHVGRGRAGRWAETS